MFQHFNANFDWGYSILNSEIPSAWEINFLWVHGVGLRVPDGNKLWGALCVKSVSIQTFSDLYFHAFSPIPHFPYSVRIRENTGQKKRTLFTQWQEAADVNKNLWSCVTHLSKLSIFCIVCLMLTRKSTEWRYLRSHHDVSVSDFT